jgi:hypothetical protein
VSRLAKYVTRKHDGGFAVFARTGDAPLTPVRQVKKEADAEKDLLLETDTLIAKAVAEMVAGQAAVSAIATLQASPPQLTTLKNVQIIKTGIEYPLSSGPATFTPEDLAQAVAAQDDPAISQPRIWLGHPDDPRIHGQRSSGPPSGEPAVGKVTNMRLEEDGHMIIGDLEGVPMWLAGIMASAFPSRSIEGAFDVETVTGHKWRLVISGLALLGVVWPGVSTLEDIASLYTNEGPADVEVVEATKEIPVTITASTARTVEGQVTVEDLRRSFYENLSGDQAWWWIRAIYLDPNEFIVDDDEGSLYRVPFEVSGEDITFGDPKAVKVKYVNASNGGVTAEPINAGRAHVALFASRDESRPEAGTDPQHPDDGWLEVSLESEEVITINLTEAL